MTRNPEQLFGAEDLNALFPDEALLTILPWRRLVRPVRSEQDRDRLSTLLAQPPRVDQFRDLDPRKLAASQPAVTRVGVAYYLHPDETYRRTGRTWADQFDVSNKHPVVHRHGDELVVLSGHHRAAAALLAGRPLRARLIQTDWRVSSDAASVITPSLLAGGMQPVLVHWECSDRQMAEVAINLGQTAWLLRDQDSDVRHLLRELAVEESWLRHQIHYARTGRIRPPRPEEVTSHN